MYDFAAALAAVGEFVSSMLGMITTTGAIGACIAVAIVWRVGRRVIGRLLGIV